MPFIILDQWFDFNESIGPWTSENYTIFIFIGYNIMVMQTMLTYIPKYLIQEKYWKTLPALITAPFNRFYLLFGYIISEFIGILIPFAVFFIIMLIFFPLSIPTLLIIIFMFIGIGIIFSGIGLFLGAFAISNENYLYVLDFGTRFVIWFSCITYPFQLFPIWMQDLINLNPIYYVVDIVRLTWIENNLLLTTLSHPIHISVFYTCLIIFPIICVVIFDKTYKKLGITGY